MRVLTKTLDSIQNQGIKPVVTKALLNPGSSAVCCTYKNWYKLHKGRIDFFFPPEISAVTQSSIVQPPIEHPNLQLTCIILGFCTD